MIKITETVTKNGKQWQISVWQINTSKPKIWTEGNFYHFNTRLLWTEYKKRT